MAFEIPYRLATQAGDNVKSVMAVNSATYIGKATHGFRYDGTVNPATHFRVCISGNANEAGQTITAQLSTAAAPTVALSSGGNDLVVTDTLADFDSGWIAFASNITTDSFLVLSLKGSNGTVDLAAYHTTVYLKGTSTTAVQHHFRLVSQGTDTKTQLDINSTTYAGKQTTGFRYDASLQPATHFRIYMPGNSNAAAQTISMQVYRVSDGATTPLSAGGNDLVVSNGVADYDSGWIAFATPLAADEFLAVAIKGSNSTVDIQWWYLDVLLKGTTTDAVYQATMTLLTNATNVLGTLNVNSVTYLGFDSLKFRWDASVQPVTHFRLYGPMGASGITQQNMFGQVATAAAPTVGLNLGSIPADFGTNQSSADIDTGWIPLATPWSADALYTIALLGSTSATDLEVAMLRLGLKYQLPNEAGHQSFSGASVYYAAGVQGFASGIEEALIFDTEAYDTDGYFAGGAPTRLTAPFTGYYHIQANIEWDSDTSGSRNLHVRVNNVMTPSAQRWGTSIGTAAQHVSADVYLVAGDYVEAWAYHEHAATTVNVVAADAVNQHRCCFSIAKWPEPFYGAFNWSSASQTAANSTSTTRTFDRRLFDTDGIHPLSHSDSAVRFYARRTGTYHISGGVEWDANSTGFRNIWLQRSDGMIPAAHRHSSASVDNQRLCVSAIVEMTAGQYIILQTQQNSGGTRTIDAAIVTQPWHSFFSMVKYTPTVVTARAYNNATHTITGGVLLIPNAEVIDTDSIHDNTTNKDRFIAPYSGWYRFCTSIEWDSDANTSRSCYMMRGSDSAILGAMAQQATGGTIQQTIEADFYLEKGDYISPVVFTNTASRVISAATTTNLFKDSAAFVLLGVISDVYLEKKHRGMGRGMFRGAA